MSHRRLDRVEARLKPSGHSEELDRGIERGIEELKRTFPDDWESILDEITTEIRPDLSPGVRK